MRSWKVVFVFTTVWACAASWSQAWAQNPAPAAVPPVFRPVPVIFDTDIGNDCDDVLAMAMLHSLATRGEVDLLAVTITKDNPLAPRFVSAINTYYGRPDIPIGMVKGGKTPDAGKFLPLADKKIDGKLVYPRALKDSDTVPEAVSLLRKTLAKAKDHSVSMVQVGFSTNLARLLDSPADEYSPENGKDLIRRKVKELSIMAGAFAPIDGKVHREYNVVEDIPSARKLAAEWPTRIFWSGFEVGLAVTYPPESILRDYQYQPHHLVPDSYKIYEPPPHARPCWDLTSALFVARPSRGYFTLSKPGRVLINEKGETEFKEESGAPHRFLITSKGQALRTREAFSFLCSEPPRDFPGRNAGGR